MYQWLFLKVNKMIKNIILDIDGTLWDSTGVVALAWNKAATESGYTKVNITADMLKKEFGLPMNVIADHIFTDISEQEKKDEILENCCVYEHEFLEANTKDISFPKMKETLFDLYNKYNLYIVSNCQKGYIELVCKKIGITELIKDYLCYGDNSKSKGDNIIEIIKRNNLLTQETIYLGDILGDKIASDHAGIEFVHAAYGFGSVPEAKYVISNISELDACLGQIN